MSFTTPYKAVDRTQERLLKRSALADFIIFANILENFFALADLRDWAKKAICEWANTWGREFNYQGDPNDPEALVQYYRKALVEDMDAFLDLQDGFVYKDQDGNQVWDIWSDDVVYMIAPPNGESDPSVLWQDTTIPLQDFYHIAELCGWPDRDGIGKDPGDVSLCKNIEDLLDFIKYTEGLKRKWLFPFYDSNINPNDFSEDELEFLRNLRDVEDGSAFKGNLERLWHLVRFCELDLGDEWNKGLMSSPMIKKGHI